MIQRPEYALVTRLQEGTESQIFKCKFAGWDEVIAVDFTRTAESVAKTGADLTKWAKQQETKVKNSLNFLLGHFKFFISRFLALRLIWQLCLCHVNL